jgi:hypothetical protein
MENHDVLKAEIVLFPEEKKERIFPPRIIKISISNLGKRF